MISSREKRDDKSKGCKAKSEGRRLWPYLAAKKLSALLRGINIMVIFII